MKIESVKKNRDDKSVPIQTTLQRLKSIFEKKNLGVEFEIVEVVDRIFWCGVSFPNFFIKSTGKGDTAEKAMVSGVAEGMERLSLGFIFKNHDFLHFIVNEPSVSIADFNNFSFRKGYETNHQSKIENPFEIEKIVSGAGYTDQQIQDLKNRDKSNVWIDGFNLSNGRKTKVPFHLCIDVAGSNGVAIGNTKEEAIYQACCELIERYVGFEVIKNKTILPTVDPVTIKDKVILSQLESCRRQGLDFIIKDLSFGMKAKSYGVFVPDFDLEDGASVFSIGTSFNSDVALKRAITEFFQGRTADMFFKKDPKAPKHSKPLEDLSINTRSKNGKCYGDMSFLKKGTTVSFDPVFTEDFKEDIDSILKICDQLKSEVIAIDHSHPWFELPVISVFMPNISDINIKGMSSSGFSIPDMYKEQEQNTGFALKFLESFYEDCKKA